MAEGIKKTEKTEDNKLPEVNRLFPEISLRILRNRMNGWSNKSKIELEDIVKVTGIELNRLKKNSFL